MNIKHFIVTQLGFNPMSLVVFCKYLPRYISDLLLYSRLSKEKIIARPALHDQTLQTSVLADEYFLQDLLCSHILKEYPMGIHLDIGSRIDGFVAQASLVKDVISLDFRQDHICLENIDFRHANLLDLQSLIQHISSNVTSISCLHTLEHIGLGRYGDPIGPNLWQDAIKNLLSIIPVDGIGIFSAPTGTARVEFNSHRVFDLMQLISQFQEFSGAIIRKIIILDQQESIHFPNDRIWQAVEYSASRSYVLAIFLISMSRHPGQ